MARKVLTNAEMQAQINAGIPVLYKGKVLKTLAQLPNDAQILIDYPEYAYTRIEGNARGLLGYEIVGTPADGVVPQFDGTNKRWNLNSVSGGSPTPPGSTKQVIYNNAGAYSAASGMEYQASASPMLILNGQNADQIIQKIKTFSDEPNNYAWMVENAAGTTRIKIDPCQWLDQTMTLETSVVDGYIGVNITASDASDTSAGFAVGNGTGTGFFTVEYRGAGAVGGGLIHVPNGANLRAGSAIESLTFITQKTTAPIIFAAGGVTTTDEKLRITPTSGVQFSSAPVSKTAAGVSIGSASLPFKYGYLAGDSTTPGTNNFKLTGTATAARTITLPDADSTLAGLAVAQTFSVAQTFGNVISLNSTTAANNKITQGAAINIGTTSTDGIILQNTTAAAVGAQQWSPRLHWIGQGWKTTATAASQTVDWIAEAQPVQGTTNPTANWVLSSQINGAGYVERLKVSSSGVVTFENAGAGMLSLTPGASSIFNSGFGASFTMKLGNSQASLYASASATALQIGTSSSAKDIQFSMAIESTPTTVKVSIPTNNTLQWGSFDAAAPVAQTLSVQSVASGTSNTAGVSWTFAGSRGTGTGTGGAIVFQIAPAGNTGSTQNSLVEALKINGDGAIICPNTVTAGGTTGNRTINKVSGTVNIAASGTSVTVTNSLVTSNSIVMGVIRTDDSTATIKNIVPSNGSFVITLTAAATAETSIGFFVINQ